MDTVTAGATWEKEEGEQHNKGKQPRPVGSA